jgi:hypothetical protein
VKSLALLAVVAALVPLGCSVGSGSGAAKGSLFVFSCNDTSPYGEVPDPTQPTVVLPIPYNLGPDSTRPPEFFAGIPIDDLVQGPGAMNQIEFRMQSTGLVQLYTDTLEFDAINAFEVARCLRGRTVNGQPDYLVTQPLPLSLATAANPNPMTVWCDWSGTAFSADGGAPDAAVPGGPDAGAALDGGMSMSPSAPRIRITPWTDIHASLSLGQTCPGATTAGIAMDGWIQFQSFGSAAQPDRPPAERDPIQPSFLINYGDRISANFDIVIGDPQVANAIGNATTPPTRPVIGGELAGYIDFILARGRSAQPFP